MAPPPSMATDTGDTGDTRDTRDTGDTRDKTIAPTLEVNKYRTTKIKMSEHSIPDFVKPRQH